MTFVNVAGQEVVVIEVVVVLDLVVRASVVVFVAAETQLAISQKLHYRSDTCCGVQFALLRA